jgi:hypothetical protein
LGNQSPRLIQHQYIHSNIINELFSQDQLYRIVGSPAVIVGPLYSGDEIDSNDLNGHLVLKDDEDFILL